MADKEHTNVPGGVNASQADTIGRSQRLSHKALGLLAKPLDPALVAERQGLDGRVMSYLEGWVAIDQANRIFGYGTWGAEVVGDVTYRPLSLPPAGTGQAIATGMYTATVRVCVRGCQPRSDVGCSLVALETPEAHEAAYKGAVTDALKRALRHFGDQMGNRLYDRRNNLQPGAAPPAPDDPLQALRRRVVEISPRLGVREERVRASVEKHYGGSLDELTEEQLTDAVGRLSEQLNHKSAARNKAA